MERETHVVATVVDFIFAEGQAALPGYSPIPPTMTLLCKTEYPRIPNKEFLVKFFGEQLKDIPVLNKGSKFIVSFEDDSIGCGVDPTYPHIDLKFFGTKVKPFNFIAN
jgi:hypothetical protein